LPFPTVSNSYFPVLAAVELGFFRKEGLDVRLELMSPADKAYGALRDGGVDFVGAEAHSALSIFPEWRSVKLLCGQSLAPMRHPKKTSGAVK
jgi:NitT/TauT family transport system substrate-binding protein